MKITADYNACNEETTLDAATSAAGWTQRVAKGRTWSLSSPLVEDTSGEGKENVLLEA